MPNDPLAIAQGRLDAGKTAGGIQISIPEFSPSPLFTMYFTPPNEQADMAALAGG